MTPQEFKAERDHHNWSRARMAKYLGITEHSVGNYERGLRKIPNTITILLAYLDEYGPLIDYDYGNYFAELAARVDRNKRIAMQTQGPTLREIMLAKLEEERQAERDKFLKH